MMKRLIVLLFLLVLAGCGSGSGTDAPASSAQVSGLQVAATSQGSAFRNDGSNGTTLNGFTAAYAGTGVMPRNGLPDGFNGAACDFSAPDGNVMMFTLDLRNQNGQPVAALQGPIASCMGKTGGKIMISFPILAAGSYSCTVSVVDASGRSSNTISTNFIVN